MRKLLFAAAVAVLVWAALVVPLPLASLAPVPATPVDQVVTITGEPDLPDDLLFTAVQIRQPTTVGTLQILFDEDRSVQFIPAVVPPGMDEEEFIRLQRRQFRESIRVAAAVGLEAAGRDVSVSGDGARVVQVLPGSPAADVLQQEDVIVSVDGEEITLASELAAIVGQRQAGEEVELTIRREGEAITETVELAELQEIGQAGLGVLVSTVNLDIELPIDVEAEPDVRVGGISAGLMIALTVYDAATDDDLVEGRLVAGTGSISLDGRVGAVSGVAEKVAGAVEAGADVFLVPEELADQAREAAPEDLEVIPVATLQDALDALEG